MVCWSKREDTIGGYTIHHICGYPNMPSKMDIRGLINELRIDEEFGMTDMIFEQDYQMSILYVDELAEMENFIVRDREREQQHVSG